MQRLEVSGAVRPIYGSLGVKRLKEVNILDKAFPLFQWYSGSEITIPENPPLSIVHEDKYTQ